MRKVFILLNTLDEYTFSDTLKRYLGDAVISIGDILPENRAEYDLIVPWCYRKKIPNLTKNTNVVVFHSSDLPSGKGWAPIFHTIMEGLEHYTVSGMLASDEIDAGDIVVKAKFGMKDGYTADILRVWDIEITARLMRAILDRFVGRPITGMKQTGRGTYRPRRTPADNRLRPDMKVRDVIKLLRACEKRHPAFLVCGETTFNLRAEPAVRPEFPDDLEITFYPGQPTSHHDD
ncbi:MAG: hypothetical protein NTY77_13910 [Elusimicrobia bacterium]|nr:hypothetical protein [Elusimicrobiota bacterium]